MKTSTRFLPLLFLVACIPSMPGSWSGSPPPLPPPPPAAASALDDDTVGGRRDQRHDDHDHDDHDDRENRVAESRSRSSESRTESHKINGREMSDGSSGSSRDSQFPQPSARQMKDLQSALDDLPTGERINKFYTLIDPFYLSVEQLVELVEELPRFDRVKAIDIAACSVVDPENASRITGAVPGSDRSKAIGALTKKCYRKNNWDKRPPGKMSHHAAPPPGAYLLPSER